jgi:ATP phosphoribosyltransferase
MELGFGKCRLCVQAPVTSKITDPAKLAGKRIVTSFPHLTKKYFEQFGGDVPTSKLQQHYKKHFIQCCFVHVDVGALRFNTTRPLHAVLLGLCKLVLLRYKRVYTAEL